MVDKYRRGLPSGFVFEPITPVADLGDYLDETRPAADTAKAPPPQLTRGGQQPKARLTPGVTPAVVPVVEAPAPPVAANADARLKAVPTAAGVGEPHLMERPRPPRHTGPRREINMSPETLRMSDELLELIRGGSGQRDTKANELVHALVLLAFEAKDTLDPYTIPKRGRWGTPTARAYPLELKNAFLQALLKKHA